MLAPRWRVCVGNSGLLRVRTLRAALAASVGVRCAPDARASSRFSLAGQAHSAMHTHVTNDTCVLPDTEQQQQQPSTQCVRMCVCVCVLLFVRTRVARCLHHRDIERCSCVCVCVYLKQVFVA